VGFKVGVDVGGTFTDLAAVDAAGQYFLTKTPSTPSDEATGVLAGLGKVAAHYGLPLEAFLAQTDLIVHGTTVATNTMLQYNGARTGLLTTAGFRDEIDLRRGIKESLFDVKLAAPTPLVPRRRRLGVPERVDYQGTVLHELDEAAARAAIRRLAEQDVEAVAICFLFSFLNPAHEQRVLDLVREELPGVYACTSSDVLPQIREFERVSTTVVNAYVGPKLQQYLERLVERLRAGGYCGELYVMQSNGGMTDVAHCARRAVYALYSGPAGGVAAAVFLGEAMGQRDLITVDMGGTSYDICLIKGGRPATATENWVGRYHVAVPMIDVHSIGAGGGSIAWVDSGGALRVGPRSAGARPGPACYGLGGSEPTVTDADLLLGYLGADSFAGGEITLDVGLAERAIRERVAMPLGLDVVEAAHAIYRIVNANMVNGIRVVSVQRGHDPREFSLMAFGGAGGVHAAVQARDLAIPTIVVPRAASVFCALGDLIADVRITEVRTFAGELTAARFAALVRLFADLEATTRAQLPATGLEEVAVDRWADLRYLGEVHEVAVPVRATDGSSLAAAREQVIEDFHALHEQLYAYRDLENRVEVLNVRVDAVGRTRKPALAPAEARPGDGAAARKGTRPAYFGEASGYRAVPVYDGARLRPGDLLAGPCIVEEAWTTILVLPGDVVSLDPYANYVIAVGGQP